MQLLRPEDEGSGRSVQHSKNTQTSKPPQKHIYWKKSHRPISLIKSVLKKEKKTTTWTPQEMVFGDHYLNHQKPPVGGTSFLSKLQKRLQAADDRDFTCRTLLAPLRRLLGITTCSWERWVDFVTIFVLEKKHQLSQDQQDDVGFCVSKCAESVVVF